MCDFRGFKVPEMTKVRPVVVISPRRRRGPGLYTVVPSSTQIPNPVEPFHHLMDSRSVPIELGSKLSWAKCDMLYTVSLRRLSQVKRHGVLRALGLREVIMNFFGLDAVDIDDQ